MEAFLQSPIYLPGDRVWKLNQQKDHSLLPKYNYAMKQQSYKPYYCLEKSFSYLGICLFF